MPQAIYETSDGKLIEYELTPELEAFLPRVLKLLKDPTKTANDVVELVYGAENPIMDKTLFPGRGAVTKAIHGTPIYRVMADLIHRKVVQDRRARVTAATP